MLKANIQLSPRKFLPRIKTKRHGLRSSVLPAKTNKSLPKTKVAPPPKPKKKVTLRPKGSDTSNTDMSSEEEDGKEDNEEEELPTEKSTSQIKRNVQRATRKKICTRSKSEMRRVTRSCSSTPRNVSTQNLSRRPTRKTKEAAAVYMELLGRKLVSPDLENDDNDSVESFPELPSARRITQTENELKAKVKQVPTVSTRATVSKNKDSKINSFAGNKRLDKSKNTLILRSKRLIRMRRYREEDSDEESESSVETNQTRPITRQSLGKLDKPISRSLRSSTKNTPVLMEVQSNNKPKTQVQACVKTAREKFMLKRKYNQNVSKASSDKTAVESKQKSVKGNRNEHTESEEETLGMLLKKIKKKKEDDEEGERISDNVDKAKDSETKAHKEAQTTKESDLAKESDDEEESFRGFTKKAISKGLNSCQTHANVNLLTPETDDKSLKALPDVPETTETTNSQEIKEEPVKETESPIVNLNAEYNMSLLDDKSIPDMSIDTKNSSLPPAEQTSKNVCKHEDEISSNLINMPLTTLRTRKERVNMSTEQIEKWLNESSLAKEESKLEMETVSTFRYDPTERLKDVSHLSISTKIQHLVRPVNVTLLKLPSDKSARDRLGTMHNRNVITAPSDAHNIDVKLENTIIDKTKMITEPKEIVKNKYEKVNKDSSITEDTNDTMSKSDQNSIDGSVEKKSPEKKIFQPRKPFLSKVKERKIVTPNVNAFSPENESSVYAFESDTEVPISTPFRRKSKDTAKDIARSTSTPTAITTSTATSTTFETKLIADANKTDIKDNSETLDSCKDKLSGDVVTRAPTCEKRQQETQALANTAPAQLELETKATPSSNKFELPKHFANLTTVQVLPLDKLTTSWSNVNCSASIAVQVNLDETTQEPESNDAANSQKSTEISTQTETNNENDDDNDGQLFYIPLQPIRSGPNLVQGQQLIQGVAVKLTEGPTGPNQRVLLHAKLVTKPPLSVARCPPIGTVQPTTRPPPNPIAITVEQQVPSTSTTTTVSTSVANMPSAETTQQPILPVKNDTLNRPNVSTSTSSVLEKLAKSPKSARERKTSIDSAKSGKRYILYILKRKE